jgi:hypothetical protein
MTATATGNPPRGQIAPPGHAAARRRRIGPPRASTTPGTLRLIQAALVVLCLAWGALAAINTDQGVFTANAAAGADAFTGLEAGVIALALVAAVGCAWGLSRRLAEYR